MVVLERRPYRLFVRRLHTACFRSCGYVRRAFRSLGPILWDRPWSAGDRVCSHRRKPPRKALSFSPARQCGGNTFSLWTLPPPTTVSLGRNAAVGGAAARGDARRRFFF